MKEFKEEKIVCNWESRTYLTWYIDGTTYVSNSADELLEFMQKRKKIIKKQDIEDFEANHTYNVRIWKQVDGEQEEDCQRIFEQFLP